MTDETHIRPELVRLVRAVEATLAIEWPNSTDKRFRTDLLQRVGGDLAEIPPALRGRLYAAACKVKNGDVATDKFRRAVQAALRNEFTIPEPATEEN